MQLKQVDIPNHTKMKIQGAVNGKIPQLVKYRFQTMFLKDKLQSSIKNLDTWLDSLDSEKYFTDFTREGNSNFSLPLILRKKDLENMQKVCKLLDEENVEFRIGTAGGGNQARQPYLKNYEFKVCETLDNADHIHDYGLYVGNHPELKMEQIIKLCRKLNEI